jgi:hypothetical protein
MLIEAMNMQLDGNGHVEMALDLGFELVDVQAFEMLFGDTDRLEREGAARAILVHTQYDVAAGGVGHGHHITHHLDPVLGDPTTEVVAPLVVQGLLFTTDPDERCELRLREISIEYYLGAGNELLAVRVISYGLLVSLRHLFSHTPQLYGPD